ncbi:TonB-dependent receptor [Sphingomonas piscis]|uniref:TonB-dependent receptor n=1 Tax=Sphingomonas piscis TaxID=2714943 RepID=A0A6G7YNF8_9SPHN|nr:TonB-dependent receptor [Sphingomonas piscis]QIK78278.1 TonB-dependent receptor [Sphingomonas piscis]
MQMIHAPMTAQEPAIVVVGSREDAHQAPNTTESKTAEELRQTTNVRNTEDALRYFPSLLVRKRHIGDTQAPLATRTSGVGASARSLIYSDGVLLSALIGNNNSFASPRWGMVSPEEIDRVDVLYGPFSARYPGNAIGGVVEISTRMPGHLQGSVTVAGNRQHFDQYGTDGNYPAYQIAGTVGDKAGPLSWFLSANHVDSKSQPLAYITVAQSPTSATPGRAVTGAFDRLSRTGSPIFVIGAGGFERQRQDNFKAKMALDLASGFKVRWQSAVFLNDTNSHARTYLTDAGGNDVLSGVVNIGGRNISIPATAFSNQVYRFDERHWMHSASIEQAAPGFFWSLTGSIYDYGKSEQRIVGSAAAIGTNGAGSVVRMNGTGWRTLDLHGYAHATGAHQVHVGAHYDGFTLKNARFATADWKSGERGALTQLSRGHTRTFAIWAEDQWSLAPSLMATIGARYEWWKAYGGRNFSMAPVLAVEQPEVISSGLSPKASLRWQGTRGWSATLSAARAIRFPTVSELYQAIATGPTITVPNPNLRPEKANSAELAVEHRSNGGHIRLSLFREVVRDALLSQSAPLPGSTQLFNYVQNVGKTRTNGLEASFERRDLLPRFDVSGSFTLTDPTIVSDPAFRAAEGKNIPQVPRRKATLVGTWRATNAASFTLAGRYASRSYGTIDNSDVVAHTYQGFEPYLVLDARAVVKLPRNLQFAVGAENFTDKRYFLFHPFPGRTLTAEVGWRF